MKCRPVNVMEGQGENPPSNSMLATSTAEAADFTAGNSNRVAKIQLKQQKRQLATATVGQDTAEAADTTAGNSNSWPRHSAKATHTASCLSQLSKSWLEQHKQQLMLQLAACHS